jgi:predicted acetyltransferase
MTQGHIKIGDIQQALGDGAAALQSYRADLAIAQKLAAQDPGNALWQVDLTKSQIKVALIETDATLQNKLLNQALTTLQALRSAGKLDATDRAWLEKLEAIFSKNPLKP